MELIVLNGFALRKFLMKNDSRTELAMQMLATLCAEEIAENEHLSVSLALSKFLQSTAAVMLFDKSTGLWMNGPDYIVSEYYNEVG